jgi:hypothetical protein
MRIVLLLSLVAGAGCAGAGSGPLHWREDLSQALREAGAENRPLLVLSIVGDLRKRC